MDNQNFSPQSGTTPQVPPPQQYNSTGINPETVNSLIQESKFFGIWTIISGAILCFTCIGLYPGIPLIFAGLRLKEATDHLTNYAKSNFSDISQLQLMFEKQRRYFYIQRVMIIVSLIIGFVAVIFYLIFYAFLFAYFFKYFRQHGYNY